MKTDMRASFPKDLTGISFGRLTVLSLYEQYPKQRWLCRCECGNERVVYRSNLLAKNIMISCGCYIREISTTHGLSRHPLFRIWADMRKRCFNENCKAFKNYGGRGITICDQWSDFKQFYDWSLSNGYEENLTIDRIENDRNYSPDNCRWVSRLVQQNNTRRNVFIEIEGETKSISAWARTCGLGEATIRYRFHSGITGRNLLSAPNQTRR